LAVGPGGPAAVGRYRRDRQSRRYGAGMVVPGFLVAVVVVVMMVILWASNRE
jgi:hypothetical protein